MAWNDEVVTPQGSAVPSQTVCLAGNATLSVTADGVEIKNDVGNPVPVSGTVTANAGSGSFTVAQATAANLNATVVQGTATNLKTQAEAYQGGSAVGASNALYVRTNNTLGGFPMAAIGFDSIAGSVRVAYNNPLPVYGSVTANVGSQGESTVSTFTSTASATLKASNANRKVLTIYNEGAGNLHVLYGSGTASTTNYSVLLAAGDYLEIDKYTGQVNAIFATAGNARVTEIT